MREEKYTAEQELRPNNNLATRGFSGADITEKKSRQILESKFPLNEAIFFNYDGKTPNLDGHIEFFDEKGSTTVILFYQLKGTIKDINYHDCERELLNYAYRAHAPIFLILVNIPQEKVYWEHIDKAYISAVLGIIDISKFNQKTKRITFSEEKKIDNNSSILIDVCRKYYQDNAENIIEQRTAFLQEQEVDSGPSRPYTEIKEKLSVTIKGIEDKLLLYFAFIYLLKPFFLDQRHEKRRRELLKYLLITGSEERFIIESLIKSKMLGRSGDMLFVNSRSDAISVLNHFVDSGRISLEEITTIFS
jgi:hypothetical protein